MDRIAKTSKRLLFFSFIMGTVTLIPTLTLAHADANVEKVSLPKATTKAPLKVNCLSLKKLSTVATFYEQWLNYLLLEFPEYATYQGFDFNNGSWSDDSLRAIAERKKMQRCLLDTARRLKRKNLKEEDRVSVQLAENKLALSIEDFAFSGEYLAIDHMNGVHFDLNEMLRDMPKDKSHQRSDILSRLRTYPALVEQKIILLKLGLEKQITHPRSLLAKIPQQIDEMIPSKVEESPYFAHFKSLDVDYQKQVLEHLTNFVYPALQRLKLFLSDDYIPSARESTAWKDLPNGEAWYALKVREITTLNLKPDEIHNIGLKEVSRIKDEMNRIKEQVKFKGSLSQFINFLRTDRKFFFQSGEEILTHYRDLAKRVEPELVKLFKELPSLPYGIKEIPKHQTKYAAIAFYSAGNWEAKRAGFIYFNVENLKAHPKWSTESLFLHEGVPGHHLERALSHELKHLPKLRRDGHYTAFVEGWGLYSEKLGHDLGLYKDPYSAFGQLANEMWRAARLVMDTGLHHYGWPREKALAYAIENIPGDEQELKTEVDRYINWPGQALAYKLGELKILELKKMAEESFQESFDIRDFHHQLLRHGPIPLEVLEANIKAWIGDSKVKKKK